MAKQVTAVASIEDDYSPKETVYVACDDRSVYVFGHFPDDRPRYERRFNSDGRPSTSNAKLPTAVDETMEDVFGDWGK